MQEVLDRLKPCCELVLLSDHALEWVGYIRMARSFFDKFGALFLRTGADQERPHNLCPGLGRIGARGATMPLCGLVSGTWPLPGLQDYRVFVL